jgi:hypothetical protein
MNRISIMRGDELLASRTAGGEVLLHFHGVYQPGDLIAFESSSHRITAGVDHTVRPARLYLPDKQWTFRLPLEGDLPRSYPPFAFQGEDHLLTLAEDAGNEYRNLACNPADQRLESGAFPHASANVETRDESVFFARSVIDGLHIANSQGAWPYLSWGIGGRAAAAIRLDFGREVLVDAMALYLRADFQHSGYWTRATVHLSDGFEKTFPFREIDGPQVVALDGRHSVAWMQLDQLIKNNPASLYPSLRQWEVYGQDSER